MLALPSQCWKRLSHANLRAPTPREFFTLAPREIFQFGTIDQY